MLASVLLAPAYATAQGAQNPSYAASIPSISPVTAAPGDASVSFTAPGNIAVTVTVKSAVTSSTILAPPIATNQSAVAYFQAQIAAAGAAATLQFPKSTYNFPPIDCVNTSDPAYVDSHILIQSVHDLVIDGQGSTLNFQSDCPAVTFNAASRITFKNFNIDWPAWQSAAVGKIVAVGQGPNGYTYSLQETGTTSLSSFSVVTPWDSVNNTWSLQDPSNEIYYNSPVAFSASGLAENIPSYGIQFTVGDTLLARNLAGQSNAVTVWNSQDITIESVNIYSAPSLAFLIVLGRGLHLNNVQVTRLGDRPISTVADAVHFGSYGGDIIIENSIFAYQGDDGLNIHTGMLHVPKAPSCVPSANCPLKLAANFPAQNGDTIGLFNPSIGFVATAPASCAGGICRVNIAPIAAKGGFAANLSLPSARYVVRNNQFLNNRARGALLQSPYGMVANNIFQGQSLFALYLVTSAYWLEGPGAQYVTLSDNTISSPGDNGGLAAVVVAAENKNGLVYVNAKPGKAGPPIPAVNQTIAFVHNSLSHLPGPAFYISSAMNVTLSDNLLSQTNLLPYSSKLFNNPALNENLPIVIDDASAVNLTGNVVGSAGSVCGQLAVDPNTTASISCQ